MMDRSAKLMKESGMISNNGVFDLVGIEDLNKSYNKTNKAIHLQIDAKKIEIDRYKQLAEAERHANEKTLELLRSMDKLSETAVDAVDATSLDAVKLQSRSFMEMPKMNFAQNAENDLGSAQQELRKIYETAARIADAYIKEGESRKQGEEDRAKSQEQLIKSTIELLEKSAKRIQEKYEKQQKKAVEQAGKLEGDRDQLLRQINDNLGKLARNVALM